MSAAAIAIGCVVVAAGVLGACVGLVLWAGGDERDHEPFDDWEAL